MLKSKERARHSVSLPAEWCPRLLCLQSLLITQKKKVRNANRIKALEPTTGLNKLYLQTNHLKWRGSSCKESKSLVSVSPFSPSP